MPHRRQRNARKSVTTRPLLPPAPPRWFTTTHAINNAVPLIQITFTTDVSTCLTLAYTYDTPGTTQRHLVRYGVVRPHHYSFQFTSVYFIQQSNTCPSTTHDFFIRVRPGCHNIYYQAFDNRSPDNSHSFSPIHALAYCSTAATTPTSDLWQNDGIDPPLQAGDWFTHLQNYDYPPNYPPLSGTNCIIYPVLPPTLTTSNTYASTPPHNIVGTVTRQCEMNIVQVTANNPVFNKPVGGHRIQGLGPQPSPPPWATRPFHYQNLSAVDPRPEFLAMAATQDAADYSQWEEANVSPSQVDNMSPDPALYPGHLISGQITDWQGTWETRRWTDGDYLPFLIHFSAPIAAITDFQDISRTWRKLPNPALP